MDRFLLMLCIPALLGAVRCQTSEDISPSLDIDPAASLIVKRSTVGTSNIQEAVVLTREQEQEIVKRHNSLRSVVKPSAVKMRKVTWNNELATIATNYSRNCIYKHSSEEVRKHSRFSNVGENLYISTGMSDITAAVTRAVTMWYNETKDYEYKTRTCERGKKCGHYTQVAWDDTFKIGCGITICKSVEVDGRTWKHATLFSCNYGPGGNYDRHPFVSGSPCSKCDKGDTCENNLCVNSIRDETFDNSKSTAAWSEWSSWSTCSTTCQGGIKTRERTCSSFVSLDCVGLPASRTSCSRNTCKGEWTKWGRWGSCSVTCGNGVQKKTRSCKDSQCLGPTEKTKPCTQMPCQTTRETATVIVQSTSGVSPVSEISFAPTIFCFVYFTIYVYSF